MVFFVLIISILHFALKFYLFMIDFGWRTIMDNDKQKKTQKTAGSIFLALSIVMLILLCTTTNSEEQSGYVAGFFVLLFISLILIFAKQPIENCEEESKTEEKEETIHELKQRLEKEKIKRELMQYSNQTKECKYCGSKNPANSNHCDSCGAPLDK